MRPSHVSPRRAHPNPGSAAAPHAPSVARSSPRLPPPVSPGRFAITPSLPNDQDPDSSRPESAASIVNDPFFQRFDPATPLDAVSPTTDCSSVYQSFDDDDAYDDDDDDDEDIEKSHSDFNVHGYGSQRPIEANKGVAVPADGLIRQVQQSDESTSNSYWPPPRRDSLTAHPSAYRSQQHTPSAMEAFNIAVIGSTGVGKSSFIQRVLGLARPPISNASTVHLIVDNVSHVISLLELDLEYFELDSTQPIQWPKQINGHIVPRVDAALILYDVMNPESVRELPQTLAALTNSNVPSSIVACKCENPPDTWKVDAEHIANHEISRPCIATYKLAVNQPEVANMCLQTIVRAAISHRREEHNETFSRRRAQSVANLEAPDPSGGRPLSQHSKHSRASSDFSLLRGFSNQPISESYRAQSSRSPLGQPQGPGQSPTMSFDGVDPLQAQTVNSMLRTPGIRLDKPGTDSFLDVEESDAESYRYSDDIPILQRNDDNVLDKQAKIAGVTFDELVDRLIAPRLSRADNNFSDIFLCLYRKFAAPGDLFSAILERLDQVRGDKTAHYLSKTATQLRIIEMVAKWVSLYPGDFARPLTRRNLEAFIRHLSTEPIFSIAAQHMRRNLQFNVSEDDDTGWANSDDAGDLIASEILSKDGGDISTSFGSLRVDDDASERPSASSDMSFVDRGSSMGSQLHSMEYEREAALLDPSDTLPMNKFRYHIFMDIPDDDIADELTRIDWAMFASIRTRDFVRHVSLSAAEKEKCKSLRNVDRMVNHFNHIAKWVANMILLRDKAKHRAQILEKFMNIATKLRQLNNYNGLAAVLAGVNGTAIHRLTQTRALVPPEVQKRFARLGILMGTQKSYFAYRLAWENSPLPRIPFMPLHRRDLVSAEEGSKTFVGPEGERINWKKFEVLGEVLLPIMRSQGTPYPNLSKHDPARELILNCRMPTDEEDIYQRSVHVESTSGGLAEPTKKKFPWFAK